MSCTAKRSLVRCEVCGGENITFAARVSWNVEVQKFEIEDVYTDEAICETCAENIDVIETMTAKWWTNKESGKWPNEPVKLV